MTQFTGEFIVDVKVNNEIIYMLTYSAGNSTDITVKILVEDVNNSGKLGMIS